MALNVSNQNGMLSTDHFLDLKSIPRVLYSTNQFFFLEIYNYLLRFNSLGAWVFTRIPAYVIAVLAYSAVI